MKKTAQKAQKYTYYFRVLMDKGEFAGQVQAENIDGAIAQIRSIYYLSVEIIAIERKVSQ